METRSTSKGALVFVLTGLALGCSQSSTDPQTAASVSEIRAYERSAQDIQSANGEYVSTMESAALDSIAACRAIHERYDADVRLWVSQMFDMSDSMDRFMSVHGGAAFADLHCAAEAMLDELGHHAELVCSTSDLESNRAEARRHRGVLLGYAEHAEDRCGEMIRAVEQTVMWGTMMDGCYPYESDGGIGVGHHYNGGDGHHHHVTAEDGRTTRW